MSRYDGLIIPRSYSEYINKTDAATLQQALQLSGVLSGTVAAGDNKAVKSAAVDTALQKKASITSFTIAAGASVTLSSKLPINQIENYLLFGTILTLTADKVVEVFVQTNKYTNSYYPKVLENLGNFNITFSSGQNSAITNNESMSCEIVCVRIR